MKTVFAFIYTFFLRSFRIPSLSVCLILGLFSFTVFGQTDSTKNYDLSELVVKSTRANAKTGMTFTDVYKKEIQKQNLGQDIPFLLNQTPSVVVTSDAGAGVGYTGIRIRGTDPTRINVTLNGIPYNDSESQGVYWVNMPDFASSIQSIQVQRGVGSSTNGAGAFGASININTLGYSQEAFGETNVSVGSFNTLKTNILASTGLLKNRFVMDVRLSKITSNGFIDRSGSNLQSFYVSGGYYHKNNFVRFNVFSGKEITKQAWYGTPESVSKGDLAEIDTYAERNYLDDATKQELIQRGRKYNFYTYENQVDNYTQTHYQLISSFQFNKNWRFNPTLHATRGKGFYEEFRPKDSFATYNLPNIQRNGEEGSSTDFIRRKWLDNLFYGAVWSLDYDGNKKIKTTFGGGWNRYDGDHYGEIIWAKDAENLPLNYRWYDSNGKKTETNVYAKLYDQITSKLSLYFDLQYRNVNAEVKGVLSNLSKVNNRNTYHFLNPKAGINYQIAENTSGYASFSVGNKEPSYQDFVDNAPTIPKAETLHDLEIGYRFSKKKFHTEATFYLMEYKNQLVLTGKVNNVGEAIRVNVADSYRRGIELQAAYAFAPKWQISGNATLSKNRILNFSETVVSYDETPNLVNHFTKTAIAFSPAAIAGVQLHFVPTKGVELSWLTKYVGKQYLDNTSNEARKLDAYVVNDLRMSYTFHPVFAKEVNFNLLINNLLNTKYTSNGYTYSYIYGGVITENFVYPQAGTNFLAALRLRF